MKSRKCGHEYDHDGWPNDELCPDCFFAIYDTDETQGMGEEELHLREARKLVELRQQRDDLLEACEAFVVAWEKSLQLEKTDVALRMAKAAIAKARGS